MTHPKSFDPLLVKKKAYGMLSIDVYNEMYLEAQKTEQDQSVMNAVETPVNEDRKVVSYKEVELPNGDIEMVPVYEDDWNEDGDS